MSPPGDRLACPWCDETGVESGDACRLCGGSGVIYLDEIAKMRRLYDCARPPTAIDLAAIAVEIFAQGEPDSTLCEVCRERRQYWRKDEAPEGEKHMEGLCVRCSSRASLAKDLGGQS